MILWRGSKAVIQFLIDYIFGDDWTVAVVIGVGALATWGLIEAGWKRLVAVAPGGDCGDGAESLARGPA